ncbi:low molecular weight protein-tyrosine-phosphatase [Comamonas aquatilis]
MSKNHRQAPDLSHLARKSGNAPLRVLMVCMGNICRSPTAHGVLEKMVADAGLANRVQVDSAGTHGYHAGEEPDARSQLHAMRRGYDLSQQRARQLSSQDFEDFDLVLVMDSSNETAARKRCPPQHLPRLHRLTDFCQTFADSQVPDPYYGGNKGFEHVLDLVEDACTGVLQAVRSDATRK